MSNLSDKRTQILLDFIVYLATFLVAINFGCMLLSWLLEMVISLVNFWTNNIWSGTTNAIIAALPTLRVVVGVSSILVSLLLTWRKLQPNFLALNLPEDAISSQDVPNIYGFDPATKQRLENVLATLIKMLSMAIIMMVALDILRSIVTKSAGLLSASSMPILIISMPVLLGLAILKTIIHNK